MNKKNEEEWKEDEFDKLLMRRVILILFAELGIAVFFIVATIW